MATTSSPSPANASAPSERVRDVFLLFLQNVRVLLVPIPDDRPLDQFLAFRDKVYEFVKSEAFLEDLTSTFKQAESSSDYPEKKVVAEAMLEELMAFSRAVEVLQATTAQSATASEPSNEGWWKKARSLLPKASIVTGSLKDFAESHPYVKSGLSLFKELIELFSSKG